MPTLMSFLGPEHSWATQTSAADFIKAIITVSANASQNEQTCIGPNELTRQLVSQPCVEQLIKYMLGGGNPLTCGVGIVIEVIRKNNSDYDPEGVDINAAPSSRDPIYLGTLLRLFAQNVPDFMSLILNAPAQKQRLSSTFGDRIEPLGFDRFKTCELMAELLHCSNMMLLNENGAEELIAARDSQRQLLRVEGKLQPATGGLPSPTEDVLMQAPELAVTAPGRKLEVMNVSADDDGFEEVSHAADEESSHGVLELPDAPTHQPSSSLLDKDDDDFVDEPLTSPLPNSHELGTSSLEQYPPFEDVDLVVAPLSPTKTNAQAPNATPEKEATSKETAQSSTNLEGPPEQAQPEAKDETAQTVPASEAENPKPEISTDAAEAKQPPLEDMSPHPEDTPAPLFSVEAAPPASQQLPTDPAQADTPQVPNETGDTIMTDVSGEASLLEQRSETPVAEPGQDARDVSVVMTEAPTPAADGQAPPKPVVGDYLKMQFVEHGVVPTILGFFFGYPWNNFLHNVVYDIVQQVFNGPMDRGFNPTLAISLFEAADITNQIINGQLASEKSQAENKTRMGYMGHLTLIAEEVVKFTERHPPELLSEFVLEKVMAQDWVNYVEGALAETRERDNAILGGVRPEVALSRANNQNLMGSGFAGLNSIGIGGGASSVLAEAGLNGGSDVTESGGGGGGGIGPFAINAGTLMSGFGSSSDEDEDEEQDTEEDVNNEVGGLDSYGGDDWFPNYDMYASLSGFANGSSGRMLDGDGVRDDTAIHEPDYDDLPDAWNGPGSRSEYGPAPSNFFRTFSRLMNGFGEHR